MTHNFVASYTVHLPFDRLLQPKDRLGGGWALSGITHFSTGLPVTLFNNGDTSLLGTQPNGVNNFGLDEPNFTPGALQLNPNPRNGHAYFNTTLFTLPHSDS